MDLDELLGQVNSKQTFFKFLKALMNDKISEDQKEEINPSSPYDFGANGWENDTISSYLESIVAFGEDSNSISEEANWKNFALLLYSGKFYE